MYLYLLGGCATYYVDSPQTKASTLQSVHVRYNICNWLDMCLERFGESDITLFFFLLYYYLFILHYFLTLFSYVIFIYFFKIGTCLFRCIIYTCAFFARFLYNSDSPHIFISLKRPSYKKLSPRSHIQLSRSTIYI